MLGVSDSLTPPHVCAVTRTDLGTSARFVSSYTHVSVLYSLCFIKANRTTVRIFCDLHGSDEFPKDCFLRHSLSLLFFAKAVVSRKHLT